MHLRHDRKRDRLRRHRTDVKSHGSTQAPPKERGSNRPNVGQQPITTIARSEKPNVRKRACRQCGQIFGIRRKMMAHDNGREIALERNPLSNRSGRPETNLRTRKARGVRIRCSVIDHCHLKPQRMQLRDHRLDVRSRPANKYPR